MDKKQLLINGSDESTRWLQWGDYHRLMFGWKAESDIEMIALWIGTFRRWGFKPDEMFAATETILKKPTPTFKREDHINFLYGAVYDRRANMRNMAPQDDYSRGQCVNCFNSGIVTVPLLADVINGEWVSNRTCGVWCTCYDGRNYSSVQTQDGRKLMGLHEYAIRNGLWKQQQGNRRARDVEMEYLKDEARSKSDIKSRFIALRDRIAARFGLAPAVEENKSKTNEWEDF